MIAKLKFGMSHTIKRIYYRLREFRGGIGMYNNLLKEMNQLRPNSANWQSETQDIIINIDELPVLYNALFNLGHLNGGGGGGEEGGRKKEHRED
jgi:hypothetical protein